MTAWQAELPPRDACMSDEEWGPPREAGPLRMVTDLGSAALR